MGQATSSARNTMTFAHLATFLKDNSEQPDDTLLLTKPHLYGFANKSLSIPQPLSAPFVSCTLSSARFARPGAQIAFGRVDSGYGETEGNGEQLAADLAYVDHTYYGGAAAWCSTATKPPLVAEFAARLTFTDVSLSLTDKKMQDVCLSGKLLASLSPNIGLLTMIQKLDISNNHLTSLPDAIGYLQNLQILSVAHNQLVALPDTIGYLLRLSSLDASDNQISALTPCISHLKQLQSLALAGNQLSRLPVDIGAITTLTNLDVSRNPLTLLPAEIIHLAYLRQLKFDDCPLLQDQKVYQLAHSPPSLREICARKAIQQQIPTHSLPCYLLDYLSTAKRCTSCRRPYLESFVIRRRLIERSDQWVPVEYRLCSAHWIDDDDRILDMFAAQPREEFSTPLITVRRPPLPLLPKQEPRISTTRRRPTRHKQNHAHQQYASSSSTAALPSSALPVSLDGAQLLEIDEETQQRILPTYWPSQRLKKVMSGKHAGFSALKKLKRPSL